MSNRSRIAAGRSRIGKQRPKANEAVCIECGQRRSETNGKGRNSGEMKQPRLERVKHQISAHLLASVAHCMDRIGAVAVSNRDSAHITQSTRHGIAVSKWSVRPAQKQSPEKPSYPCRRSHRRAATRARASGDAQSRGRPNDRWVRPRGRECGTPTRVEQTRRTRRGVARAWE